MTATAERVLCRITTEKIDVQELIDAVQTPGDGAVCVFYGVVREDSRNKKVRFLEYDAYPEMAEKKMREILDEVRVRWPGGDESVRRDVPARQVLVIRRGS